MKNNTKHSKTKLACFSHPLRHSARQRGAVLVNTHTYHMAWYQIDCVTVFDMVAGWKFVVYISTSIDRTTSD